MAYTEDDLTAVRKAIADLSAGNRVNRVSKGDSMIDYGQADLPQLQALENRIISNLNKSQGRTSCFRVATSKGL